MIPVHDNSIYARSVGRSGSAMILVVVLTVLLSLIGLMFVLASRIEQATSASANVDRDLSAGVDAVVDRIEKVLVDDLFGAKRQARLCSGASENMPGTAVKYNERYDAAGNDDPWLMSINPGWSEVNTVSPDDLRNDIVTWSNVSDLYFDVYGISGFYVYGLMGPGMKVGPDLYYHSTNQIGAPQISSNSSLPKADADGDGVWDSIWVKLPNINSSKGQPIYSAVRILDNCAMLNLNTAFKLEATSDGQYLSAVDYERFRRGSDRDFQNAANDANLANRIRLARMVDPAATPDTVEQYHNRVILNIEKPDSTRYRLFDLADELEIRNRLLLTTAFEARFERLDVANYTLDAGGGLYAVPQIPFTDEAESPFVAGGKTYERTSFDGWKIRMSPVNFDDKSGAYYPPSAPNLDQEAKIDFRWKYDRRHICTFYSFDRNIRSGPDMILDPIVESLRTAYVQEVDPAAKAQKLAYLDTVMSVIWPANGSAADTRGLVIAPTPESRKAILHLLYALRAYYLRYGLMEEDSTLTIDQIRADLADPKHSRRLLNKAARKAAQVVANMIDYLDDTTGSTPGPFYSSTPYNFGSQRNPDPTFIDEALVRQLIREASRTVSGNTIDLSSDSRFDFGLDSHIVYGYERQPFISELYCSFSASGIGQFAVEFVNPYDQDIRLEGWRVIAGNPKSNPKILVFTASNSTVPKGTTNTPGRFVLRNTNWGVLPNNTPTCEWAQLGSGFVSNDVILLQRPIPDGKGGRTWLTVDGTTRDQVIQLIRDGTNTLKRDDRAWKFAQAQEVEIVRQTATHTLGQPNNVTIPGDKKSYQMPVADDNTATVSKPLSTLGDFDKILTLGSEWISADDPNAITHFMGLASNEGDVRTDIVSAPEVLRYVGFLNRPAGNLPGRININTASWEVIRAAIPPRTDFVKTGEDPQQFADNLAKAIVRVGSPSPFTSIADLFDTTKNSAIASLLTKWKDDPADNVGDPSMTDDIEERDWILSRMSNIFTVRSDTFTAYIAIRIGTPRVAINATDPSKTVVDVDADRHYIAIFDRSAVDQPDESPRLVALHRVPDAR
ncbi:MAG: hypothetical protein GX455_15435 [Phycisphaerae bacterium]|nr:hypothetical protein [Phycisphaerae bacterium]